jgi:undecaprenyl-diphosphatase
MARAQIAVLITGLAGFALLAVAYDREPLATIDEEVAEWVVTSMPAAVEWLARPFSWIGGWIGLVVVTAALVAYFVSSGRRWEALWAAVTIAGVHVAVTPFLKEAFDRPRPTAGSAIPLPPSDAFPSGHAASAAATFGLLAVVAAERWPERARLVWASALALVVAIGASRVVLGVHWVTDVAGGWWFGAACLAAALLLRDALRVRRA